MDSCRDVFIDVLKQCDDCQVVLMRNEGIILTAYCVFFTGVVEVSADGTSSAQAMNRIPIPPWTLVTSGAYDAIKYATTTWYVANNTKILFGTGRGPTNAAIDPTAKLSVAAEQIPDRSSV
eukprot:m.588591 g.588591  ORF g.588591 m.588591 type:complete len:121 (+) comp22365_c0_seq16:3006-3368(+)